MEKYKNKFNISVIRHDIIFLIYNVHDYSIYFFINVDHIIIIFLWIAFSILFQPFLSAIKYALRYFWLSNI